MARHILLTLAVATAFGGAVRADDKPLDRAELDKRAYKLAYDTALKGTAVFNTGDQAGCLKLYEGALPGLTALLDHRPDVVRVIDEQMAAAKNLATTKDKAFALRKALDSVLDTTGGKTSKKPLWDRLGGEKAVRAVVHDFVIAAAPDSKVNFFRDGKFKLDEKGVAQLESNSTWWNW